MEIITLPALALNNTICGLFGNTSVTGMQRSSVYFLIPFIFFLLALSVYVFSEKTVNPTYKNLRTAVIVAGIGAMLIGAIAYVFENKRKSKK